MRWSLLQTLAHKHKKTTAQIIGLMGKNVMLIKEESGKHNIIIEFLSSMQIQSITRKFFLKNDNYLQSCKKQINNRGFTKLKWSLPKMQFEECAIIDCQEKNIELYHIKKFIRRYKGN
jgi:hypothetical protein